ncbi:protein Flattop isoform X2 [Lepisosteus oculatus]|uniref:protein Flattop isoform X2 n=1 Tax=Lepisosteus oculatus TaxID=7918 RepID=UPI0035F51D61
MASSFTANQYEDAFKSQKLQSWTIPKQFKERPSRLDGHTQFIVNDRGHLLPGLKSKKQTAWGSYVGTWDLPRRISPGYINYTARSEEGVAKLRTWVERNSFSINSRAEKEKMNKDPQTPINQEEIQQPEASPRPPSLEGAPATSRPATQEKTDSPQQEASLLPPTAEKPTSEAN